MAKTLAKEGKTFADAAQWRLDQVRTGVAGPIRVPSQPTEHELASAVGAVVGAERGSQLAATHGIGAAAVAMSTAGAERHMPAAAVGSSFIEEGASTSAKERLTPEQIRAKAEKILRDSKASLQARETDAMSASAGRSPRAPHRAATATTASRLMQADQDKDTSTMRFSEAQSKVESTASALLATASMHSRKSADALALAKKLRQHAVEVAEQGKLAADTGLTGLTEVAEQQAQTNRLAMGTADSSAADSVSATPVGAQQTFFGNLPPIHGDALFENTRKWLQSHDAERRDVEPSAYGEQRNAKKPDVGFEPPRFEAIRSTLVPAHARVASFVGQPTFMPAYGLSSGAPVQQQAFSLQQQQQQMMPMMDAMMNGPLPDLLG